MAWNVLFIFLILICSQVLCKINKNKNLHECFTVLKCGEISTNLSIVFQGFPGLHGSQGVTGLPGPIGPQGLTGPP
ncbi:unnamed protein product, partial [Rotaria sordida]